MPIADGSNYQQKTKSRETLLHLAAHFNSTDIVWSLADNGAKISFKNEKKLKHHLIANVTALKVKHLLLVLQIEKKEKKEKSFRDQSEDKKTPSTFYHSHFTRVA